MHVLREFCLKWGHDGELLADEDFGEEFHGSGEDHGLLLKSSIWVRSVRNSGM